MLLTENTSFSPNAINGEPSTKYSQEPFNQPFCSGYGKYHSTQNTKNPQPYTSVTFDNILRMAENPASIDKDKGQWAIFSTLPSRAHAEQRENGTYWALWLDIDEHTPLDRLKLFLEKTLDSKALIFSSRSSTVDLQKWRIIVPLANPIKGADYLVYAQILNDLLQSTGITPDRKTEATGQVAYLPNKGDFYEYHFQDAGFDLLNVKLFRTWYKIKLADIEANKAAHAAKIDQSKANAAARVLNGNHNPVTVFNEAFDVETLWLSYGAQKCGKRLLSPNSSSGSPGIDIKTDQNRWISAHDSDSHIGVNGSGDAFDLFVEFEHNGDRNEALKAAGSMFKTSEGVTLTKANQRAHMRVVGSDKPKESRVDLDTGEILLDAANDPLQQAKPEKNGFALKPLADLLATEYKADWLIEGLMEVGNLGLIFGQAASCKSLIVQDACFCISAGIDFHGKRVKQGNVVYIAGEGFAGLSKRFKALEKSYGISTNNLFLSEQPAAFMDAGSAFDVSESIKNIGGASLIVIDTLHRNMGAGDENSSKDFAQFLSNIDQFLKPTGATILIIHHNGHDAKERSRGSSAIRAAMDIEYMVTKDGDIVTMSNTKMKDFEPPVPVSFKLKQVEIGRDSEGESVTSVVLQSTTEKPLLGGNKKRLNHNEEKAVEALRKAVDENGIEAPQEVKALFKDSPYNIPRRVVSVTDWRKLVLCYITVESTPEKEQGAKRVTLNRIKEKLSSLQVIGLHGDYIWFCNSVTSVTSVT